jgi:hypothetical protein
VRLDVPGTPYESLWQATTLDAGRRAPIASAFVRFVVQPEATRAILARSAGAAEHRFRPTVHVTIWS